MALRASPGLEMAMPIMPPPGLEGILPMETNRLAANSPRFSSMMNAELSNTATKAAHELSDRSLPMKIPVEPFAGERSAVFSSTTMQAKPGRASARPALMNAALAAINAVGGRSPPAPLTSPSKLASPTFPPGVLAPYPPTPSTTASFLSPTSLPPTPAKRCTLGQKREKVPAKNKVMSKGKGTATSKEKGHTKEKDNCEAKSSESTAKTEDMRLCSLLGKLRTNTTDVSILDVSPWLCEVAQDQDGAQFLEERLPKASQEVQAIILGSALPHLVQLSLHPSGHKFVLCMLEVASPQQKRLLAEQLAPQVKVLSLDSSGCRVIQKTLKSISNDSRQQLVSGLKENPIACIKSMHGNHVMQVCVEEMPADSVSFIAEAVLECGGDNAAAHMYACRVVMRLLEYAHEQMKDALQQILLAVPRLAKDRYGNYVLQHIVEHGDLPTKQNLISQIMNCGVLLLAGQKYAHNVIEKCIAVACSPEHDSTLKTERAALTSTFLSTDGGSHLTRLAGERFGSIVVEFLMDHLKGEDLDQLIRILLQDEAALQYSESAAPILAKIHGRQDSRMLQALSY